LVAFLLYKIGDNLSFDLASIVGRRINTNFAAININGGIPGQ
jgi:hypothetical protein